jgi:hypothetical protein
MRFGIKIHLTITLIVGSTLLLFAQEADTAACIQQSCCSSHNATPAGIMISHVHTKNEWMISYKYMNMQMGGLMNGAKNISSTDVFNNYLMSPTTMQMDMHMLMVMYGISHRLTVMGMFNYNQSSMQMEMFTQSGHHHSMDAGGSGSHSMESSGFGDIKLYALYGIVNKPRHQFLASLGLSIPTGSINMKGPDNDMLYPDKRLPYSMQSGSGTYDVLPCLNYVYQHKKITASAQVSSTIRTQTNTVGYKLGNELMVNSWFAYQWLNIISSSLRLEGVTTQNISGYDASSYAFNEPSANPYNYGGQKVNAYIGSVFQLKNGKLKKTGLAVEYGLPVYQYVNGIQMKTKQLVNISLAVGF